MAELNLSLLGNSYFGGVKLIAIGDSSMSSSEYWKEENVGQKVPIKIHSTQRLYTNVSHLMSKMSDPNGISSEGVVDDLQSTAAHSLCRR